jgi:hypothetical protein
MSRRRHTVEVVAQTAGWALARLLGKLTYCPECHGVGEGVHTPNCEVHRAVRTYEEWRDLRAADAT